MDVERILDYLSPAARMEVLQVVRQVQEVSGPAAPQVAPEPERCPTCGSRNRAYCNNVRAQASWVTCADPWHASLVEGEQA